MPDHLITSDPGGRPVIAGTHVTVEEVLKELAASEAVDVILTAHPELDRDAVQAALEYAAEQLPVLEPSREEPHACLHRKRLRHVPRLAKRCGRCIWRQLKRPNNGENPCWRRGRILPAKSGSGAASVIILRKACDAHLSGRRGAHCRCPRHVASFLSAPMRFWMTPERTFCDE